MLPFYTILFLIIYKVVMGTRPGAADLVKYWVTLFWKGNQHYKFCFSSQKVAKWPRTESKSATHFLTFWCFTCCWVENGSWKLSPPKCPHADALVKFLVEKAFSFGGCRLSFCFHLLMHAHNKAISTSKPPPSTQATMFCCIYPVLCSTEHYYNKTINVRWL